MYYLNIVILVSSVFLTADCLNTCNGWIAYKEEKCIKVVERAATEMDAETACQTFGSSSKLLSIRSAAEQEFATHILSKYFDKYGSAWLGLKYNTAAQRYEWLDGQPLTYSNWAPGSPDTSNPGHCVQMSLAHSSVNNWLDTGCNRPNLVVCEKPQVWDIPALINALEALDTKINELKDENQLQKKLIIKLEQNLVPIGFIYIELPNAKSPQDIWPTLEWTDVSETYAGVFFRVVGGEADEFGEVQDDDAPLLVKVDNVKGTGFYYSKVAIPIGEWSNWITTGCFDNCTNKMSLAFQTSDCEVRPINMATRVWMRTK